VWVGVRGDALTTCALTDIDPRAWKAKSSWPCAAGTGDMGEGENTYCKVKNPQWFLNQTELNHSEFPRDDCKVFL